MHKYLFKKHITPFLLFSLLVFYFLPINAYGTHHKLYCEIPKSRFLWNANNSSLINVTKQISKLTCKNYIFPQYFDKQNKISIIFQKPITLNDAEKLFINLLMHYGF